MFEFEYLYNSESHDYESCTVGFNMLEMYILNITSSLSDAEI